jgi:NRAMP (natural resistance-associated macrophage protein)-like metal ion transporter
VKTRSRKLSTGGRRRTARRPATDNRPRWRVVLTQLGPGLITGASDDDPSGIATYAQAGAKYGGGLLWSALVTYPLMAAVQEICDRTALASGKGLGELAAERFAKMWRPLLVLLLSALIAANALNIGADLLAVGSGMHLLHLGPVVLWAALTGVVLTALVLTGSFSVLSHVFKGLTLALVAYLVVVVLVHPVWTRVLIATVVPHVRLQKDYFALLVAVLGTTISPYLFFWQSGHRVEDLRGEASRGAGPASLRRRTTYRSKKKSKSARVDVLSGMALSNVVMWAIILSTSQTLGRHGNHDVGSAAEAAGALRPLAGHYASLLFALGFIGTGLLAVPVLAGSGAIGVSGLLGRRWGFSKTVGDAPLFYGLVLAGTAVGTMLTLLHVNAMHLLVVVALINGIAAAPFLGLVMLISNDRDVMGGFRNGLAANVLGWLATALMAAAAVAVLFVGTG